VETTYVLTEGWLDKEDMIHVCNIVLPSLQKKEMLPCDNIDETAQHYAK
jgi:hypothetical protein